MNEETTFQQRQLVICYATKSKSCIEVTELLQLNLKTVKGIIRHFKYEGRIELKHRSSHP